MRKYSSTVTFTNLAKDLKGILMDCNYEHLEDVLIDCTIDSVVDINCKKKNLDRGEKPTVAKTIELGQQHHESKNQLKLLREEARVDQIQGRAQTKA
ncbi:hypothetical protein PoB_001317100 [Plakobranchus ocellatus]|uniref:Uncharacterized protein n=1 Tax=Plakobranchus ocellatus TaxID=259542 RepID=A0AAV3YWC0_9GAST|nr:hypothetical protein PoB_001317100 [Plakobranchus ocellatus]